MGLESTVVTSLAGTNLLISTVPSFTTLVLEALRGVGFRV